MLGSAAKLTIGNGLSQLITLAGFALLGRLYTPAQFGLLAVIVGVASIASLAVSGRYEMTILLPKSDRLAELALTSTLALSTLATVAFTLVMIGAWYATDALWPQYWLAIGLTTFAASAAQTYGFKRNREKRYSHTVYVLLLRSVATILCALALTRYQDGLVWAHVAGYLASLLASMAIEFRLAGRFFSRFSMRRMIFWLRKHNEFLKFSLPAVFMSSVAGQLPVFLLSYYFGVQAAGYYSFINKTVMAPVALVSGSLNVVSMQKFSNMRARGQRISPGLRALVGKLGIGAIFASIAFVFICLGGAYGFVFGAEWKALDALAIMLTPSLTISFVSRCLPGFAVLGRNGLGLVYQVLLAVGALLSIVGSYHLWHELRYTIAAYSVIVSIAYLGQVISILAIAKTSDSSLKAQHG